MPIPKSLNLQNHCNLNTVIRNMPSVGSLSQVSHLTCIFTVLNLTLAQVYPPACGSSLTRTLSTCMFCSPLSLPFTSPFFSVWSSGHHFPFQLIPLLQLSLFLQLSYPRTTLPGMKMGTSELRNKRKDVMKTFLSYFLVNSLFPCLYLSLSHIHCHTHTNLQGKRDQEDKFGSTVRKRLKRC